MELIKNKQINMTIGEITSDILSELTQNIDEAVNKTQAYINKAGYKVNIKKHKNKYINIDILRLMEDMEKLKKEGLE
jgi:1,2-phenylacetyl-CoA epoxidase PaaB subunit